MKLKVLILSVVFYCTSGFQLQPTSTNVGRHLSIKLPSQKVVSASLSHSRLFMNTESEAGEDEGKMEKKIAGRKKRVNAGYKISAIGFTFLGLIMTIVAKNPFYSSGPLLTAGFSYILIGAAKNDRLSSNTYKRLNIALIEYGLIGFIGGVYMKTSVLWNIICFITFVNAIKGYGYGLKGWELGDACAKEDMVNGMKENLKCISKVPNIKSFGYLTATLTVAYLKLSKLLEVFTIVKDGIPDSRFFGTRLISLARFMVMTIAMFTLKDAADRGRLEGTTFIELNAMVAAMMGLWAYYAKLSTPLGKAFGFFSLFSAFNGVSSYMKKK